MQPVQLWSVKLKPKFCAEGSDLWSGVTSLGTKSASYSSAESGKPLTDIKFDKGTTEKACIIYPMYAEKFVAEHSLINFVILQE